MLLRLAESRSNPESQRDSIPKPRVARHELPWETSEENHNPNGVVASITRQIERGIAATALRLISFFPNRNPR